MPAANYYIDLTNGNDARTGLKIGNSTIDSTADTTHFVDDLLTGADDYINGSYFYNVTRSLGSLITDFVALTDTVTLTTAIAGMTAGDTYYILDSWLTLGKYTSTTVRTAGDIAYVRAGGTQTSSGANLEFDEDGTQAAIISIIGCDATVNDPWVDASNTYPILSFGDAAYQVNLDQGYWLIKRMTFKDSTKTATGTVYVNGAGCQISYCNITDNAGTAAIGLYCIPITFTNINNCTFDNNKNKNIGYAGDGTLIISNCTFNGGGETTDYGIYAQFGTIFVSDSTFGSTSAHDTQDIYISAGRVYCRNCTFNKTTLLVNTIIDEIHSEDDDGTFGNQVSYYFTGTVTKSATARSGGATSSAQMMPTANCGAIFPLCINNLSPLCPDFSIYNTSTSPLNVDIYIRADSAWGTYPTAAQLYTEASYLNNAASASRATVVSTEVLTDGTTWVRFRCTMTPARAGFIYMKVYLKLYAATEGVLVDIRPVVS